MSTATMTTTPQRKTSNARAWIAYAISCALIVQPMPALAQVTAAAGASAANKPVVDVTANGRPLVQITAPNAAGVSNNQYSAYNVTSQGVILNNAQSTVLTQQGGYVGANPYLAAGGARIIVNQVVGGSASQLSGYTEVAGQQAEVVIANPAGIYCSGCGFINTTRGVLTTGTPVYGGSGSLDAFHVTGGQIQIDAGGLNGSNVDQVDLIARSVKINGQLWAKQRLNVVTGANDVNYTDLSTQALTPDANKPSVAIDVAQLGGMYANKIKLVGTEAGVGVNSLGTIAAQAGDFTLNNQGQVRLAGSTSASGNVQINAAGNVANSGALYAGQNADVSAQGQISNTGTLAALGNVNLNGATINSSGALGAGIDTHGNLTGNGNLAVSGAGAVAMNGQNLAGGNIAVSGSSLNLAGATTSAAGSVGLTATGAAGDGGNIDHTGAALSAGAIATLTATGALLNNQGRVSADQLAVNAASLSNQGGTLTQTGTGDMALTTAGGLDNSNGVVASNAQNMTIRSGSLTNQGGQINHAGTGALALYTGALTNNGGAIATNGQSTINAISLTNTSGVISAANALGITTSGGIGNSQGAIEAGGAVTLTAANISNTAGRILSLNGNDLSLSASGQLTNTTGAVIGGNGNTIIHAASLSNAGSITAAQALGINVVNLLDNSGGALSATGALTANAASFKNVQGNVSGATVGLTIAQLDNSGGRITSNQLNLNAANLINRGGTLTQLGIGAATLAVSNTLDNSNGGMIQTNSADLTLAPASLNNNGGTIMHAGTGVLTIAPGNGAGTLTNVGGMLASNGQIAVSALSFDNTDGTVSGQGNVTAGIAGALNNVGGTLRSNASLSATSGGALNNTGGKINAGGIAAANNNSTLNLSAVSVDNTGGSINNLGAGTTTVSGTTRIVNSNATQATGMGSISGNGAVTLATAVLSNTQGGQISGANLQINANSIDNSGGRIGNTPNAGGNVGISTSGAVTNAGGQIGAARNLTIAASTLYGAGAFTAAGDVALNLQGDFNNAAGNQISAANNLTFTLPGNLTNAGTLLAVNDLSVNAANINNTGSMAAGGLLRTNSATLTNSGTIVGASVSLTASQSIANLGTTALIGATGSAGKLELLAPDIENRDDTTATDTQAQTAIYGLGQVVLAGGKDANGNYTSANLVNNQSALIQSGGDLLIQSTLLKNTRRTLTTSSGFTAAVDPNVLARQGISLSGVTGQVNVHDANSIGGVYIEPPHGGLWNSNYLNTSYSADSVAANAVLTISPQAQIISGGNMTTAVGTLQNYWSKVAVAGNIALSGTLDQNSWQGQTPLQVQVVYSGTYNYQTYRGWLWNDTFCASGCNASADVRTYALPSYESSFSANGALTGSGVTINNVAGNASITPLGLSAGQTLPGVNPGPINGSLSNGGVGGAGNPILAKATALSILNNITVPQGGLFKANTAPGASYLIETNPAFANLQQWLSSDYYFQQMGVNPSQIQKRLGDGFYEQRLVQNQVLSLTGKDVLGNYANTQAEFQALMTSGAALARSLDLAPGMALSAAQVAQLTSNVVIMQDQIVDGQTVLVPVVYLAQVSQQNSNGPLIAAGSIDLSNTQGFTNSGTVSATGALTVTGQNIDNRNGALQSGSLMTLGASGNIDFTSANVTAGSLQLAAGGDFILDTATKTVNQVNTNGGTRSTTTLGPIASLAVTGDAQITTGGNVEQNAGNLTVGGNLAANVGGSWQIGTQQTGETQTVARMGGVSDTSTNQAVGSSVLVSGTSTINVGKDLVASGAQINLAGGGSIAANNVELLASKATSTVNSTSAGSNGNHSYSENIQTSDDVVNGTTLHSGQSLNVTARAGDINLSGSTIQLAQGSAALTATGNINIGAATEDHTSNFSETHGHSFLGSGQENANQHNSQAQFSYGSTISADSVSIQSGKSIAVTGSNVIGTNNVALTAAGNVNITTSQDTLATQSVTDAHQFGLLSSNLQGFSIGSATSTDSQHTQQVSNNVSTVGTTAGNVTITSGKDVHVSGSNVIAGKAADGTGGNIAIAAQNITIDPVQDTSHVDQTFTAQQRGLSMGIVGTPLDTLRNLQSVNNGSGTKVQKVKGVFEEIGASAGTAPQVALTYGSSSTNLSTTTDTLSNIGSSVTAAGNLTLTAIGNGALDVSGKAVDGNINVTGSQLAAGGEVTLDAAKDVNVVAATNRSSQTMSGSSSSTSLTSAVTTLGDLGRNISGDPNSSGVGLSPFNAATGNNNGNTQTFTQIASGISAGSVSVTSHAGDINVVGSAVAAKNDVSLIAQQGKINVGAGENDQSAHQDSASKTIGDLGSSNGGTATSVGIRTTSDTTDTNQQLQNPIRSSISSNNGDVTLNAKQDLTVQGSDLSANQNLTLIGQNVNLEVGTDTSRRIQTSSTNQIGVTASVGGVAGQLSQTVNQSLQAQASGDSKLANLYAVQAAITAANGVQGVVTSGATPALVKVTVALGSSSSDSQSDTQATQQQGSTLAAGKTLTITATGDGTTNASGKANNGDINAVGSQISATDVALNAARDVNLVASQDTISNTSTNSSGGASIGIGFALGGEQNGFTLELGANKLTADANGNSATNQNTVVTASNTLTTISGRDTNLIGAELRGNTVVTNVGGDLNVVSTQDTDNYKSAQSSTGFGASICVPPFCYGTTVQANVNFDSSNTDSAYKSVVAQSGIFAGTGGYDINVANNTGLVGGLIASSATADKNILTTGTLTVADLANSASYNSDSTSINASANAGSSEHTIPFKDTSPIQNALNNAYSNLAGNTQAPAQGDANGLTKSAISAGTVTITDASAQLQKTGLTAAQTVASLDSDTANANQSIGKIFDLQTIQRNQEMAKVTSNIAQQIAPLLYQKVGDYLVGDDTAAKVAVHALIGGLMSKAIGGDFGTGAVGAGAAMLAVEVFAKDIQGIDGISNDDRNALVQLLGLVVGKVAAQAVGGSSTAGNAASVVAKLAAENNFLKHQQLEKFKGLYSSCKTDDCRAQVLSNMKTLSDAQDAQLKTCVTAEACAALVVDMFNPLQQNGFAGFFISASKDILNFCGSGDAACRDTLTYVADHSNQALAVLANSAYFANGNAQRESLPAISEELQTGGIDKKTADVLAVILANSAGTAALLGSTAGSSTRALAFQRGLRFQNDVLTALDLPENKSRITVTLPNGAPVTIIPDALGVSIVTEVKDVVNLSNSNQFRGYLATDKAIQLIVSPNTQTISLPLQKLIADSGGTIQVFDPISKSFSPWVK